MSEHDGGPAFPEAYLDGHGWTRYQLGMSLRDWFAGQIVAAGMVNASGLGDMDPEKRGPLLVKVARLSYEIADAMLAARQPATDTQTQEQK